jgi:hypothetical protein
MIGLYNPSYMLLVMLPALLLTMFAQWRIRSAFAKWSRVANQRGLTGLQTAQIIMQQAGLQNVKIGSVAGELTDHYDPSAKEMRLSESSTRPSVAAMAIVAHELGHAEQDLTGSGWMGIRSALVPAANIGSQLGVGLIILGMILRLSGLAWLGIILFAAMVLFTLVTLPVEFDASRRAKRRLAELNLISAHEAEGVNAVLNAAALTYVAAAATAVMNLLYYTSVMRRRS